MGLAQALQREAAGGGEAANSRRARICSRASAEELAAGNAWFTLARAAAANVVRLISTGVEGAAGLKRGERVLISLLAVAAKLD